MIQEPIICPPEKKDAQLIVDFLRTVIDYYEVDGDHIVAKISDNMFIGWDNVLEIADESECDKLDRLDFFWGCSEEEAVNIKNLDILKELIISIACDSPDEFKIGIEKVHTDIINAMENVADIAETPSDYQNCEDCDLYEICDTFATCPKM